MATEQEARQAIIDAVAMKAPKVTPDGLLALAQAFALVATDEAADYDVEDSLM